LSAQDAAWRDLADAAFLVADTHETLDHVLLDDRAMRLSAVLWQQGLREGDVVAVLAELSPPCLEVLEACRRSGLVVLPAGSAHSLEELAYVLNDSGARAVFTDVEHGRIATSLVPLTPYAGARFSLDGEVEHHRPLGLVRSAAYSRRVPVQPSGTLHYTSVSSGRPTGYRVPDPIADPAGRRDLAAALGTLSIGPTTTLLSVSPVSDPVSAQLVMAVHAAGGQVVTLARSSAAAVARATSDHRPTVVHLSTAVAVGLAKLAPAARAGYDLSSVRLALLSSPSCPADAVRSLLAWWGPVFRQLYAPFGAGVVGAVDSVDLHSRPGSVGRSIDGTLVVVDDLGSELPTGETGSVLVRRDGMTIRTMDRGRLDGDGHLHLEDRDSFSLEPGGQVIVPRDLENLLVAHPAVADAAVIGVADSGRARTVSAFVEPAANVRPGADLERELIDYLRDRVPPDWVPQRLDFTARMPRTPSGKLDKRRLAPRRALGIG
jgi:fatty-acyl-CoA synthase